MLMRRTDPHDAKLTRRQDPADRVVPFTPDRSAGLATVFRHAEVRAAVADAEVEAARRELRCALERAVNCEVAARLATSDLERGRMRTAKEREIAAVIEAARGLSRLADLAEGARAFVSEVREAIMSDGGRRRAAAG